MRNKFLEAMVGLFIIAGFFGLLVLAFKVSGLTNLSKRDYYPIYAEFDNIGGLKVRAPVAVAGVKIGKIYAISLDPKTFKARVVMYINKRVTEIPIDSSASILTQGILGSNYISIEPGFMSDNIKPGGVLETTHSALILENLIGQLLFNVKDGDKNKDKNKDKNTDKPEGFSDQNTSAIDSIKGV